MQLVPNVLFRVRIEEARVQEELALQVVYEKHVEVPVPAAPGAQVGSAERRSRILQWWIIDGRSSVADTRTW